MKEKFPHYNIGHLNDASNLKLDFEVVLIETGEDLKTLFKLKGVDLQNSAEINTDKISIATTYLIDETDTIREVWVYAKFTCRTEPRDVIVAYKAIL